MKETVKKVLRTGEPYIRNKRKRLKQRLLRPLWKVYYLFKEESK